MSGIDLDLQTAEEELDDGDGDDGEDADIDKLRSLLEMHTEDAPMTRVRRELDGSCHGLGLMICSRLVHRVGGWIRVESADGPGSSNGEEEDAAGAPGTRRPTPSRSEASRTTPSSRPRRGAGTRRLRSL